MGTIWLLITDGAEDADFGGLRVHRHGPIKEGYPNGPLFPEQLRTSEHHRRINIICLKGRVIAICKL